MSFIRATPLQGFPDLVRSLGGDPDALLRAAKIPRAAVGQFDAYLSFRNVIAAVEAAAVATGSPGFGRMLAQRQGIEILGPVGAVARTAPSVAAALNAFGEYMSIFCPAIEVATLLGDDERYAIINLQITLTPAPELKQITEMTLGIARTIIELLVGPDFRPIAVHLPHDPLVSVSEYNRYYGAPSRFREPFLGLTVRRSDLLRPLAEHSNAHDVLREYLNSKTPLGAGDLIPTVQLLVRHLLSTGTLSVRVVADQLSMHPRTLQRRLAAKAATYESIVDETRKDLASRLLRDTDMPLTQLSGALGYSEQSVLVWSCHRWFGATPSQYRKDARAVAADMR